jgi:uncharacterized membrane protein YbhN (UPF0104 family)
VSNIQGKSKVKNGGKILIPIIIMLLVIYEARSIFNEIDINQVLDILSNIPNTYLLIFLISAIISITFLCFYDVVLADYYKYNVNRLKVFVVAWISHSFNDIIGFGGLTGATLRTVLFKDENIDTKDMINFNMILIPTTIVGLSVMCYLGVLNVFKIYPLLHIHQWLWIVIFIFCAFLPIYYFLDKFTWLNNKLEKFNLYFEGSINLKIKLTLLSTFEWIVRSILFFTISKYFKGNANFLEVTGVNILACIAALISFIPGGIGSFDLIAIVGLKGLGYSANSALSITLLFRLYYFIIPWIIGVILWIGRGLIRRNKGNNHVRG